MLVWGKLLRVSFWSLACDISCPPNDPSSPRRKHTGKASHIGCQGDLPTTAFADPPVCLPETVWAIQALLQGIPYGYNRYQLTHCSGWFCLHHCLWCLIPLHSDFCFSVCWASIFRATSVSTTTVSTVASNSIGSGRVSVCFASIVVSVTFDIGISSAAVFSSSVSMTSFTFESSSRLVYCADVRTWCSNLDGPWGTSAWIL